MSEYVECFVSLKVYFLKLVFFEVAFLQCFVGSLLNCSVLWGSGSPWPESSFRFFFLFALFSSPRVYGFVMVWASLFGSNFDDVLYLLRHFFRIQFLH